MLALENILQISRHQSRGTIVEDPVKIGDIDNLTKLKLRIVSKHQENELFPKGELYSR